MQPTPSYRMPGQKPQGESMPCPVCKRLERTFEGWNSECIRARSSLYCTVSSRFEAYDVVEMERARSELQMHRAVCVLFVPVSAVQKAAKLRLAPAGRSSVISPTPRAVLLPSG
jgi:hypothetical protein